jgi:hypothetical protein
MTEDAHPAPSPKRPAILAAAGERGRRVHQSRGFDIFVGIGLTTYGIVHLLIAWIAVRIALSGHRGNDTQDAALAALAETVFGEMLLWVTAVGLGAMTLWQVFETIWRRNSQEPLISRAFGRVGSIFSAAAYLAVGISAARVALVGRAAREGRRFEPSTEVWQEDLLRAGALLAGVVLVAIGVRSVYRGVLGRFVTDLKDGVNAKVVALGRAGFVGKGITFGIVGVLMIITAIDGRTGPPGLQSVLRLINLSPAGGVLLFLKAIGLALFGIYCFVWAANRRR